MVSITVSFAFAKKQHRFFNKKTSLRDTRFFCAKQYKLFDRLSFFVQSAFYLSNHRKWPKNALWELKNSK